MNKLYFVAVVIALSLWFYWFQWRPSTIRSSCTEKTKEAVKSDKDGFSTMQEAIRFKDAYYQTCLNAHGLDH